MLFREMWVVLERGLCRLGLYMVHSGGRGEVAPSSYFCTKVASPPAAGPVRLLGPFCLLDAGWEIEMLMTCHVVARKWTCAALVG